MGEFIDAALSFPAVVFTFLLIVVVGYWVLVLLGAADLDALDPDVDGDGAGGGGFLAALGLGGVPATVSVSLVVALAWFVSVAGAVLLDRAGLAGWFAGLAATGALLVALALAWLGTRLLVLPVRRLLASDQPASRHDFVGRVCVIRTGTVTPDFGQAEVTAEDGSSAVIQVRQAGTEPLRAGSQAVIYDYDPDGEFFLVTSFDLKDH